MDKDLEKTKKGKKKTKKYDILDRHFNHAVILFFIIIVLFLVKGQFEFNKLYQSLGKLSISYQDMKEENLFFKEKIVEQSEKLDKMNQQFKQDTAQRISKEQFTEIYMQLQELTGMISEEKKREFYINRIVNIVSDNNQQLESETIYQIAKNIYETSTEYHFNPFLLCALIKVESNFIIDSLSDSYAYGLCQVRRFIAKELAENIGIKWNGAEKTLFNPEKNIKIGVYYLALLYEDFEDLKLALTAYNYGPFKVQEIISEETEIPNGYADKVLKYYAQYRGFDMNQIEEILNQEKEQQ